MSDLWNLLLTVRRLVPSALEKELLRRVDKNLSAQLPNRAISAPSADQATRGVGRYVCGVGQFFIGKREFDASRNSMPNARRVCQDQPS